MNSLEMYRQVEACFSKCDLYIRNANQAKILKDWIINLPPEPPWDTISIDHLVKF